jgi:hypothetical protein
MNQVLALQTSLEVDEQQIGGLVAPPAPSCSSLSVICTISTK